MRSACLRLSARATRPNFWWIFSWAIRAVDFPRRFLHTPSPSDFLVSASRHACSSASSGATRGQISCRRLFGVRRARRFSRGRSHMSSGRSARASCHACSNASSGVGRAQEPPSARLARTSRGVVRMRRTFAYHASSATVSCHGNNRAYPSAVTGGASRSRRSASPSASARRMAASHRVPAEAQWMNASRLKKRKTSSVPRYAGTVPARNPLTIFSVTHPGFTAFSNARSTSKRAATSTASSKKSCRPSSVLTFAARTSLSVPFRSRSSRLTTGMFPSRRSRTKFSRYQTRCLFRYSTAFVRASAGAPAGRSSAAGGCVRDTNERAAHGT
mmetsp:Transcript_19829/g.51904  ORF Transcript_19829/g.51904 Transcript_19829/m.51904 type:complete len:330 (+) Transcript_19829:99-1088(+)